MKTVSVCYILSYYIPDYARTSTLTSVLAGMENVVLYQARNSSRGFLRYFQTFWKVIAIRVAHDPQLYILGFRGYEFYWIVRLLTLGRPLIFDHMMSPYDSLVNETEKVEKGGGLARLIFLYEKSILHNSQVILADTDLHKHYFQELFHLPDQKIMTIPVGADEKLFHPMPGPPLPARENPPFEILFYGSFLPLHGVDVILKAAAALRDYPVNFTIIGGWKVNMSRLRHLAERLKLENVNHLYWVESASLPRQIAGADIGLGGPFGNTGQARRVITGKTFQFLAMAKPVIVGGSTENFGFVDKVNCLVAALGNEQALAGAITWAFWHRTELEQIGRQGYELYRTRYSNGKISEMLQKLLT
jgi:glycosyltransferase involved in cell wall biosynthesis